MWILNAGSALKFKGGGEHGRGHAFAPSLAFLQVCAATAAIYLYGGQSPPLKRSILRVCGNTHRIAARLFVRAQAKEAALFCLREHVVERSETVEAFVETRLAAL